MPELPDLQVFKTNLEELFAGKKLDKISVTAAGKINVPAKNLQKALTGKKLLNISRNGKELFFYFEDNQILSFHLMLHGAFYHFKNDTETIKHKIMALEFDNGEGVALTDWQKSAHASLNPEMPGIPDALSREFTIKYLREGIEKRNKKEIKELLTDQKFIRGIGNAYADEILWEAKISPLSIGSKIPAEDLKRLHRSIKKCLADAEKKIRKEYPGIISGEKRDFMKVHNSHLDESPTGYKIKHVKSGGRSTYYTDEQTLYK
jgi:formamidopyrimidine-DNA glycosylase